MVNKGEMVGSDFVSEYAVGSVEWWRDLVLCDDRKHGVMLFEGDEDYRQDGVPFRPSSAEMDMMFAQSMGVINSYSRAERNNVVVDMQETFEPAVVVSNLSDLSSESKQLGTVVSRAVNEVTSDVLSGGDLLLNGRAEEQAHDLLAQVNDSRPELSVTGSVSDVVAVLANFVSYAPVTDNPCEDTGFIGAVRYLDDGIALAPSDVCAFALEFCELHRLPEQCADGLVDILTGPPAVRDAFCRMATLVVTHRRKFSLPETVVALLTAFRSDAVSVGLTGVKLMLPGAVEEVLPMYDGRGQPGALLRHKRMCALFSCYLEPGLLIKGERVNAALLRERVDVTSMILRRWGVTRALLNCVGYVFCEKCGFVVVRDGHVERCDTARGTSAGMQETAWVGDALHKLDMRVSMVIRGIRQVDREMELLKFTTNAAQGLYVRTHYPHLVPTGRSDHYVGTVFESMYRGDFRTEYLNRVLGYENADKVMCSVSEVMAQSV